MNLLSTHFSLITDVPECIESDIAIQQQYTSMLPSQKRHTVVHQSVVISIILIIYYIIINIDYALPRLQLGTL